MALQRSVQQQNAAAKAKIERVAAIRLAALPWLEAVLRSHRFAPEAGLLVRLPEVPEQEGSLYAGIWLAESLDFWEFEVVVSRTTGELLSVDRFANITGSLPIVASAPRTGASFGYLARQVLRETRGG